MVSYASVTLATDVLTPPHTAQILVADVAAPWAGASTPFPARKWMDGLKPADRCDTEGGIRPSAPVHQA
jgi:hypothetical protein